MGRLASRNFDDELFVDVPNARIDIVPAWHADDFGGWWFVAGPFQEVSSSAGATLQVKLHDAQASWLLLDGDGVARFDQHAWYIHLATVDLNMPVANDLPGRGAAGCPTEAMYNVIEPTFQNLEQRFAGVGGGTGCQLEETAEGAFENAVEAFELLLFPKPHTVFAQLTPLHAVHTGSAFAAFDGALGGIATGTFQVQLFAFTSAELANRINIPCHREQYP